MLFYAAVALPPDGGFFVHSTYFHIVLHFYRRLAPA